MSSITKKAWVGLIFLLVVLGIFLFIPAGTLRYWQAWLYLILLTILVSSITLYLIIKDPALLKRRVSAGVKAEKEKSQKLIQFIGQFSFISFFLIPALDHRFLWTSVPFYLVIISDLSIVLGFYIVFLVFKENTFTSAIIEVAEKQNVISTGPYALVRHPMYSGVLLVLLVTPLALGSCVGLLAFIPMTGVIVWRLLAEEKYLAQNLPGYTEYCKKVQWRLIPGVF